MRLRISGICGFLAPIFAFAFIFSAVVSYPQFSWVDNALSDLGVMAGVTAVLFNSGIIIAVACSTLLGKNQSDREKIRKTLTEAYHVRNCIVHGSEYERIKIDSITGLIFKRLRNMKKYADAKCFKHRRYIGYSQWGGGRLLSLDASFTHKYKPVKGEK